MFIHNFKYTLKTLFKNKILIFWTFAFPIILGTFFNMAFSNIEKNEKLDIIDIAIVKNKEFKNNEIFKQSFKELSNEENEDRLFNIKYVTEKKAKNLLKSNKITGYLIIKDTPKVVIATNGINETIFKYVVEEIQQSEEIVGTIVRQRIKEMLSIASTNNRETNNSISLSTQISKIFDDDVNIENISNNNLSYTMIEFYTLIAMTCLYGGILGMVAINQVLPNMANTGKRISISSTPKVKLIFSSVLASYLVQLLGIVLLFIYTIFVLNIDYGNNLLLIIILALVGCLAGLSLGIVIATSFKTNDNVKTGIVISITMLGCFLSGMMGITMKYIIDKNIPIINKLNPASMITDGFYSLYYYDTLDRFYFNIISLLIFAFIMISISIFNLRRQKYDSI